MDDELFDLSQIDGPEESAVSAKMTDGQRVLIRELFAKLGVVTAADQFATVAEITGVRILSVAELKAEAANVLIQSLKGRVSRLGRERTGNAWNDRDEDTWIDRL